MKPRAVLLLHLLLTLAFACSARASGGAAASPTPTLLDKSLEFLHLKHNPQAAAAPQAHHKIELKLDISPDPVKLSQDREITVTVSLYNWTRKFVHYDFPTSQRIEILVRDPSGKIVNTWSEDQSFTNDPATITVNPGERLVYKATVATREMTGDKPYTIEASFPAYPDLKAQQQLIPEK